MKLGYYGIGSGTCGDPQNAMRVALAAEAAGFESVWTGEHVVLPDPRVSPSPVSPRFPMLDPGTLLAYLGSKTQTLRLGTGIEGLAQPAREVERPAGLGHLEISVTPASPLDRDVVRRSKDLGVDRLIPLSRGRSGDEIVRFVEKLAVQLL